MKSKVARCVLVGCLSLVAGVSMVMVACSSADHRSTAARESSGWIATPSASVPSRSAASGEEFTPGFQTRRTRVWSPVGIPSDSHGLAERPVESAGRARERARGELGDRRLVADASCLPPRDQEIWVIERVGSKQAQIRPDDDVPGCGSLVTSVPDAQNEPHQVPVPLKHTDVKASIMGSLSTVEVTQQFFNPFSGKIEAVYVFPLPQDAAVSDFLMTVGDRVIRGIIREREEAKQIYEQARAQGYVASLLTQERPNIFTQRVANIEPGKGIDITITYFNTLSYVDGSFEFVFPMVVGPRFNPAYTTDGVYARPEGVYHQGIWNDKATEVQYLRPDHRSGHDISLTVDIDTGGAGLESIVCNSHVVEVARPSSGEAGRAVVRLGAADTVPNKDFVLRYRLSGDGVRTSAVASVGEKDGFFSMMLLPPEELGALARQPLEMVFVLDCSGSMNGEPIAQAKRAIERALRRLGPDDTFQLIRFSNNASSLGRAPISATPENVRRGLDYLAGLNSEGGTMMIEGIKAALDFPHDPRRFRFVSFLTDGYIGNESEILGAIEAKLGPTRIFSFGIGSSVNRYLMDSMARAGRGCVAYLAAGESATELMDAFMDRISHPAMTDITIDASGLGGAEVYPSRVPDLFVGRPVYISGRFGAGAGTPVIRVSGNVGGARRTIDVPVRVNAVAGSSAKALGAVWARHKIGDLADGAAAENLAELAGGIRQVALEFGLMSPYTAFIAVDSSTRTEGSYGTTVAVPVQVPQGVRYETSVP